MKFVSPIIAAAATSLIAADPSDRVRWTFEDATLGKVPDGWSATRTGKGKGSVWKVIEEAAAPRGTHVLAQTSSEGPRPLFNLCVCNEAGLIDLDLKVSFKAIRGEIDQGGGPVWRYRDENNYYVVRMNPLENNFRVYKVVNGKRHQLASADVVAAAGKWHTIRIIQEGDHIKCFLNNKLHLDVRDATFPNEGKVGLWTKADAVTAFDEFSYAP